MPRLPDFIIVGFPKCGTHALVRNLGEHPEIFTWPHEIRYFGRDRMRLDEYRAHFDDGARVAGEKSAAYILLPEAMRHMHAVVPDARIIVCLRHPVHMLHSFYYFRVWEFQNGYPGGIDDREHAFHNLILGDAEINRFSLRAADYAYHLERSLQPYYAPEQVLYAVQERFWQHPQQAYDRVHRFLGVEPMTVERKIINSKASGEDLYPHVDYDNPTYREALRKLVGYFEVRNEALFERIGGSIPEWRRYDDLYREILA